MDGLDEFNIETLDSIRIEEEKRKEDLKSELNVLEAEIQKIEQQIEQNEERLITKLSQKIQQVKAKNSQISIEIQREEEKVKMILDEKYQSVHKEKEELLSTLANYENQVIPGFQRDIQELDLNLDKINTTSLQPDEANQILLQLEANVQKRKLKYEENLSLLQTEIDRLISENSKTYQQLQDKLRNSSHELQTVQFKHRMTRSINSGDLFSKKKKRKPYQCRSSTNMF